MGSIGNLGILGGVLGIGEYCIVEEEFTSNPSPFNERFASRPMCTVQYITVGTVQYSSNWAAYLGGTSTPPNIVLLQPPF